jgi:ABC-type dipeptide/oligopeptide/nickel transport system permease component
VVQAVAVVTVVGFASANLVADLLYAYLNPKSAWANKRGGR